MSQGKLPKEVHRLLKRIERVSDGQAKVLAWNPDDVQKVMLEISPNDGLYKGGKFDFELIMGEDFPVIPPCVRCLTPIYHPNIDPTDESVDDTNICLNMFELGTWEEGYGLEGALQGILFLFYHPNIFDPLSPFFDPSLTEDEFEDNVKRSLEGEEVEGFQFKRNIVGKANVLIMNLVESNDCVVDDTKGVVDNGFIENTLVLEPNVNVTNYDNFIENRKDIGIGEHEENTLTVTVEPNVDVIATNDDVVVKTRDVEDPAIPHVCDATDHLLSKLEDENSLVTNSKSTVLSSSYSYHCGRHSGHVHLKTFNALSPEVDIVLFVISRIVSKTLNSFFLKTFFKPS